MSYKSPLASIGALLISSALVGLTFTIVLAQPTGTQATDKPLPTTMNHLFIPLMQSSAEGQAQQEETPSAELAMVGDVELVTIRTVPMQINAVVRGNLPDSCTQIDKIQQQNHANQILLKVATRPRWRSLLCANVLTPFEETISLNLLGLAAGHYTVVAGDAQASFTLAADNVIAGKLYLPLVTW